MKVKLIFPPLWTPTQPYLSIPTLASFLLSKGVEVEQEDLNLEMFEDILSEKFLDECWSRLVKMQGVEGEEDKRLRRVAKFASRNVERYKYAFRSNDSLDNKTYKSCMTFFAACMKIACKAFPDNELSFDGVESKYNHKKSQDIMKCLVANYEGKDDSLLSVLLSRRIDQSNFDCDLLGISIIGVDQVIPAFSFIGILKNRYPDLKIVLGGPIVTRWAVNRDTSKLLQFYDYIDFIIRGEGEYALYALVLHLKDKIPIEKVPQVTYKNSDGVLKSNSEGETVDVNDLPPPVFNKIDIPRYFMPTTILPLLSNRGCYWGKCTFCDHSFIYNNTFRRKNTEKLLDEIVLLRNEYNANHFNFHDEAMLPSDMDALSFAILGSSINIKWSCDLRLDNRLTGDLLQRAYDSGLRVLYFGLESINERVSALMKKGIDVKRVKGILEDATRIGIFTHLFYIRGFPTETVFEFKETVDFILENSDIIKRSGCADFSLGRYSPIAKDPRKYGLKIIENNEDLSLTYNFVKIEQQERCENENESPSSDPFIFQRDHWVAVDWNSATDDL